MEDVGRVEVFLRWMAGHWRIVHDVSSHNRQEHEAPCLLRIEFTRPVSREALTLDGDDKSACCCSVGRVLCKGGMLFFHMSCGRVVRCRQTKTYGTIMRCLLSGQCRVWVRWARSTIRELFPRQRVRKQTQINPITPFEFMFTFVCAVVILFQFFFS